MQIKDPVSRAEGSVLPLGRFDKLDAAVAKRRRADLCLVEEILTGAEGSFERLHTLYATRLYRFVVKRLGDAAEAEDVVQDVFLEVHRSLASWQGRSALLTWMFGIAHHQCCRRFRRKTPIALPIEELLAKAPRSLESPSEGRVDAIRSLEVCAEILEEDVSPVHHQIFDLYYGENRPIRAIASALGKSNQAIKISLFRTRRAMAVRLEEQGMAMMA
jgi:RNA polymerase sigma-70 factor (ECF subfamily)